MADLISKYGGMLPKAARTAVKGFAEYFDGEPIGLDPETLKLFGNSPLAKYIYSPARSVMEVGEAGVHAGARGLGQLLSDYGITSDSPERAAGQLEEIIGIGSLPLMGGAMRPRPRAPTTVAKTRALKGKVLGPLSLGDPLPRAARGPAPSTVLEGEVLGPLSLGGPSPKAALPAPPMELTAANNIGPLALPQPGPGLPPLASKPRGGQWWPNKSYESGNRAPEYAAKYATRFLPEALKRDPHYRPWLEKSLAKYLKNDLGAPDDPLRDLAARGLHYDPEMTERDWSDTVNSFLYEDKIGHYTVPQNGASFDAVSQELLADAPWLAKQPVTDNIYGLSGVPDLDHFHDEMVGALGYADLPPALTLRPESLSRMSFPQAVEHVGRINQYRVKRAAETQAESFNSPAVHTFKEYPENNPMGLRWTELKAPQFEGGAVPEGFEVRHLPSDPEDTWTTDMWAAMDLRTPDAKGRPLEIDVFNTPEEAQRAVREQYARGPLQDALRYEGDTMGHCVGGYCDDVMSGKSRIFSLRDAKGEPHVTIETSPSAQWRDVEHAADEDPDFGDAWNAWRYGYDISRTPGRPQGTFEEYLRTNEPDLLSRFEEQGSSPDDIIQIKGKGNRAPKDDYLPFVQDFVKSSKWGQIGDLRNTGLVTLPDGRYITEQQAREGLRKHFEAIGDPDPEFMARTFPLNRFPQHDRGDWEREWAPHFQGYAKGGRVTADRGFACKCGTSRFKVKR